MSKLDPRRTVGTILVAVLYVALVLGAPLIVRYGPSPEMATVSAQASVPAR